MDDIGPLTSGMSFARSASPWPPMAAKAAVAVVQLPSPPAKPGDASCSESPHASVSYSVPVLDGMTSLSPSRHDSVDSGVFDLCHTSQQLCPLCFDLAQWHWPATACIFLANLDNNLSDNDLASVIDDHIIRLGLHGYIQVRRYRNHKKIIKPHAHIQLETKRDATIARNHLGGMQIGKRFIRAEYATSHILNVQRRDGRPIKKLDADFIARSLLKEDVSQMLDKVACLQDGAKLYFRTVGMRLGTWKALTDEPFQMRILLEDYAFW